MVETYGRVLATLDREPELLLHEVAQRGAAPAGDFVLVREDLGIARLRARVGEEERLQIVVDGVSDEDAVLEEIRHFFLDFVEGPGCRKRAVFNVGWSADVDDGDGREDVPCTMSDGRIPENSVR